jgi:excisionase family DNA binding protein
VEVVRETGQRRRAEERERRASTTKPKIKTSIHLGGVRVEFERQGRGGKDTGIGLEGYGRKEEQFFERLITVEDLAVAFGFAPQTIRNWVALRQIPHVHIGGKTRFRKRSIEAWISHKERSSCQ